MPATAPNKKGAVAGALQVVLCVSSQRLRRPRSRVKNQTLPEQLPKPSSYALTPMPMLRKHLVRMTALCPGDCIQLSTTISAHEKRPSEPQAMFSPVFQKL